VSRLGDDSSVLVIGAGLAAWRFVEALRDEGFAGPITVVGDEPHLPYDRPPLSKQVLNGKWDVERTSLVDRDSPVAASVSWRLGESVVSLDAHEGRVVLRGGEELRASHVVLATGARARRLDFRAMDELHTIRSRDDVERLLGAVEETSNARPWVVVGAGFLGAEVATALKVRGVEAIVLEAAALPLEAVVGVAAARWLRSLPDEFGVELRTSQLIRDVERRGEHFSVLLEDGSAIDASGVVVCTGSSLELGWLEGSGLVVDGGVVVDENLQARTNVAAIGDVARFSWRGPGGEEVIRVEHWEVAISHGAQLARFWVTGEGSTSTLVPYFWSDQYGKKIQMLGHPRADDDVQLVHGSLEEGKWLALYSRAGVVTGLLSLSQPRALMLSKSVLDEATALNDALAASPWSA